MIRKLLKARRQKPEDRSQKSYLLLLASCFLSLASCILLLASSFVYAEDMLLIPAGEFTMGSGEGVEFQTPHSTLHTPHPMRLGIDYGVDEIPQRKVFVKDFYIDRFEVTNAEYAEYLKYLFVNRVRLPFYEDIGIPVPEDWRYSRSKKREARSEIQEALPLASGILPLASDVPIASDLLLLYKEGMDEHPISDVDWYMANGYCQWKGKRLPTEEEWEKSARGIDGRKYPWGNEENKGYANTRDKKQEARSMKQEILPLASGILPPGAGGTSPIGSFPEDVSPYGVHDMGGNVAEWTSSLYRPYSGSPVAEREAFKREMYVVRGGSYLIAANESARTSARYYMLPTRMPRAADAWHGDAMVGFRCAKNSNEQ